MMQRGRFLVKGSFLAGNYSLESLHNVIDYRGSEAISVHSLFSDLSIILSRVKVIFTLTGSPLAHISILAREYNTSIILIDESLKMKKMVKIEVRGNEAILS